MPITADERRRRDRERKRVTRAAERAASPQQPKPERMTLDEQRLRNRMRMRTTRAAAKEKHYVTAFIRDIVCDIATTAVQTSIDTAALKRTDKYTRKLAGVQQQMDAIELLSTDTDRDAEWDILDSRRAKYHKKLGRETTVGCVGRYEY